VHRFQAHWAHAPDFLQTIHLSRLYPCGMLGWPTTQKEINAEDHNNRWHSEQPAMAPPVGDKYSAAWIQRQHAIWPHPPSTSRLEMQKKMAQCVLTFHCFHCTTCNLIADLAFWQVLSRTRAKVRSNEWRGRWDPTLLDRNHTRNQRKPEWERRQLGERQREGRITSFRA